MESASMKDIDAIRRENLKQIEKEAGGTTEAAARCGMSISQFANLRDGAKDSKTGKQRGMRKETARKIEVSAGKHEGWLDTDHSTDALSAPSAPPADQVGSLVGAPSPGEVPVYVPLLANAGSMGDGDDELHEDVLIGAIALSPDWITRRLRIHRHQDLRFIHAYGDSMSDTFEDGDILLVNTGAKDPSGADGIYVLEARHRVFIKRVTEKFSGTFEVTSDNPRVKTIDILDGNSQITVRGRVVWGWRGKKF